MRPALDTLPSNYQRDGTLDLSKSGLSIIGVIGAALALLLPAGWLTLLYLAAVRPDARSLEGSLDPAEMLLLLAALFALAISIALVHEAVHGLFFWFATRRRPVFGFRGLYAFAAAPGWYIPPSRYIVIGLAPLLLITLAGLALFLVIPVTAIPALFLFVVFNASGAAGDILVVLWLLTRPRACLVHDSGDAITLYLPREPGAATLSRP
jgi:hypothetical protein